MSSTFVLTILLSYCTTREAAPGDPDRCSPPPGQHSTVRKSPLGTPWLDFSRFLADPRAIKKSMTFRHPPKSPQGVKKSTQWRPRVDFSWILRSFWLPFFMIFLIFSKISQTMESRCGCSQGSILRIQHLKNHIFFNDFPLNFYRFSWTPSWIDFFSLL